MFYKIILFLTIFNLVNYFLKKFLINNIKKIINN